MICFIREELLGGPGVTVEIDENKLWVLMIEITVIYKDTVKKRERRGGRMISS